LFTACFGYCPGYYGKVVGEAKVREGLSLVWIAIVPPTTFAEPIVLI